MGKLIDQHSGRIILMKAVENSSHFDSLLRELQVKKKSIVTNCFLLKPEIEKYSSHARITFEKINTGIYFLCEDRDFFNFYFYLFEEEISNIIINPKELNQKKPVVLKFVYSDKRKPAYLENLRLAIEKNNFQFYKRYKRMVRPVPSEKGQLQESNSIVPDKFVSSCAKRSNIVEILKLWKMNLDDLSSSFPYDDELANLVDSNNVFIIRNNREIIAAILFRREGNVGTINHVAVHKEYRRIGLAHELLVHVFNINKTIKRWFLWIEEENQPAEKLYEKHGFSFDGRLSSQYLFR